MIVLAALCVAVAAGAAVLVVARWARPPDPSLRRPSGPDRRATRAQWLRQAGSDVTPTQFWALSVGAALLVFSGLAVATRAPLVALAPAVAAGTLPHLTYGHRRLRRMREWQAAWPDALRELVAAIVAGRSLTQGISALGESGPEPLRELFADFPTLARAFGASAALEQVEERMADPTSDRVIEVLLVAHERGGAIVRDVLEDLVVATTKDLKVLDEIDTEGLEMRINARAVLVLPWLVLVALTAHAGPFRDFYRSTGGVLVVGAAGLLSVAGSWWLGRLGRQPDEPRVFARPSVAVRVEAVP